MLGELGTEIGDARWRGLRGIVDPSSRRFQTFAFVLLALLIVVAVAVSAVRNTSTETVASTHAAVGKPAPAFSTTDPSGRKVTLSQFRGRPLVMNFWATWCTACQDEMPAIQAAQRRHSAQGVQVLAVDYRELDRNAIRSYLKRLNVDFLVAMDPEAKIATTYGVTIGLPVTAFIDSRGTVVAIHVGAMSPSVAEQNVLLAASR